MSDPNQAHYTSQEATDQDATADTVYQFDDGEVAEHHQQPGETYSVLEGPGYTSGDFGQTIVQAGDETILIRNGMAYFLNESEQAGQLRGILLDEQENPLEDVVIGQPWNIPGAPTNAPIDGIFVLRPDAPDAGRQDGGNKGVFAQTFDRLSYLHEHGEMHPDVVAQMDVAPAKWPSEPLGGPDTASAPPASSKQERPATPEASQKASGESTSSTNNSEARPSATGAFADVYSNALKYTILQSKLDVDNPKSDQEATITSLVQKTMEGANKFISRNASAIESRKVLDNETYMRLIKNMPDFQKGKGSGSESSSLLERNFIQGLRENLYDAAKDPALVEGKLMAATSSRLRGGESLPDVFNDINQQIGLYDGRTPEATLPEQRGSAVRIVDDGLQTMLARNNFDPTDTDSTRTRNMQDIADELKSNFEIFKQANPYFDVKSTSLSQADYDKLIDAILPHDERPGEDARFEEKMRYATREPYLHELQYDMRDVFTMPVQAKQSIDAALIPADDNLDDSHDKAPAGLSSDLPSHVTTSYLHQTPQYNNAPLHSGLEIDPNHYRLPDLARSLGGATYAKNPSRPNQDGYFTNDTHASAAVIDGVGGSHRAERATAIAVEVLEKQLTTTPDQMTVTAGTSLLVDAMQKANDVILQREPGSQAAAVVAQIMKDEQARPYAALAWIGDCRASLYRDGELTALTVANASPQMTNEAYGAAFAEQKRLDDVTNKATLSQSDAIAFNFRNHINGALGQFDSLEPNAPLPINSHHVYLLPGDKIVLTSDGIDDVTTPHERATCLKAHSRMTEVNASKAMADLADSRNADPDNQRRKPDDRTCALLSFDG